MTTCAIAKDQAFNKLVASLRRLVNEINDFRLGVRLAAAIASVTHNKHDIVVALDKARGHCSPHLRAEAMAILAKTLAEAHHLAEAREVASEMKGMDAYRQAVAHIWIARFSGDPKDAEKAKSAVTDINAFWARIEAQSDLELLSRKHHVGGHTCDRHQSDFHALKSILGEIVGMEDSHRIRAKFTSTYLRSKAEEIFSRLFAEALK